ncbi:hypothetical protein [Aquincola tertiaricarbonis]|uniref:hypothetical protein n=1 Tax=Aquincola tertiaricarbonis TaxID=391953 RepID=UPI0006149FE3|nr:hypothetical protein [Aquincola tertiaricarbonis]
MSNPFYQPSFFDTIEYRLYSQLVLREGQCIRNADGTLVSGPPHAPYQLEPSYLKDQTARMVARINQEVDSLVFARDLIAKGAR